MTETEQKPSQPEEGIEQSIELWKNSIVMFAALLLGALIGYFWFYVKHLPPDPGATDRLGIGDWGAFGDFMGGLMNPIVAFAALYWLTQSVKLQKTELQETRAELSTAAKAQEASAKANALLLKVQIMQALIQHEKAQIAQLDADLKEEIDGYVQQGASYGQAQRMAFDGIERQNVKRRAHTQAIKDHLDTIKKILDELT